MSMPGPNRPMQLPIRSGPPAAAPPGAACAGQLGSSLLPGAAARCLAIARLHREPGLRQMAGAGLDLLPELPPASRGPFAEKRLVDAPGMRLGQQLQDR